MSQIRLLAISGSLRARSSNTEALRAMALLAPPSVTIRMYEGLATLPAFNPDLDEEGMTSPDPVQLLRAELADADALVICSPEYAHGVPGSLKNALDWLVSEPRMVYKPVALVNTSPRSTHAQLALAETLRTMSAHLVGETPYVVPLVVRGMTSVAIASDPALAAPLRRCLDALLAVAQHRRNGALFADGDAVRLP